MRDNRPETPIIGLNLWNRIVWISIGLASLFFLYKAWSAIIFCSPLLNIGYIAVTIWATLTLVVSVLKLVATWLPAAAQLVSFFKKRTTLITLNVLNASIVLAFVYFDMIAPALLTSNDLTPIHITHEQTPKVFQYWRRHGNLDILKFYPNEYSNFKFVLNIGVFDDIDDDLVPDILASDGLTLFITKNNAEELGVDANDKTFMHNCFCRNRVTVYALTDSEHQYLPPTDYALQQSNNAGFIRTLLAIVIFILLPWGVSMWIAKAYRVENS